MFYPSLYAYAMDVTTLSQPYYQGVNYNFYNRSRYQGLSASFPGLPSLFLQNSWVTGDTLSLGLSLANQSAQTVVDPSVPADKLPAMGQTNALSVTYKYGDNYKFAYSISPEGGSLVTLGYERALPLLGSQYQHDRFWADWRRYIAMPWAQHHVLALRALGGTSRGDRSGNFYLGGFDSATYLTNVDLRTASSLGQSQLPMRGYPLGASAGPSGFALSAEYRFPIASVQRGYGIYPLFVRQVYGAVFAETGQTWKDQFAWGNNLVSLGAELRAQAHLSQAPSELRLGIGQGLVRQEGVFPWPQLYMDVGAYF
jgi:outer membrane protein assembly factor BamA